MWFQQIVREETGCATYMVASSTTGACAVFDPLWDVAPYVRAAASPTGSPSIPTRPSR